MKSLAKFLLFYAVIALSPSLYSMEYHDFGAGHTVDFGKPAVRLTGSTSFDDILARHMTDEEHSKTHTPAPVHHEEEDYFAGTPGSLSMHSSGSHEGSPVVTHADPDEDLTSLSDLTGEQHADVWMKQKIEGEASAKAAAKQYRQQNRAAQSATVTTDVGSLHMTGTAEVPTPVVAEKDPYDDYSDLTPAQREAVLQKHTDWDDEGAKDLAEKYRAENRAQETTVAPEVAPAKSRSFEMGRDIAEKAFVSKEAMANFLGVDVAEFGEYTGKQVKDVMSKKLEELQAKADAAAPGVNRDFWEGQLEAVRDGKTLIEKYLEENPEEGDEEEVAPEETGGTATPTAEPRDERIIEAGKAAVSHELETRDRALTFIDLDPGQSYTAEQIKEAIEKTKAKLEASKSEEHVSKDFRQGQIEALDEYEAQFVEKGTGPTKEQTAVQRGKEMLQKVLDNRASKLEFLKLDPSRTYTEDEINHAIEEKIAHFKRLQNLPVIPLEVPYYKGAIDELEANKAEFLKEASPDTPVPTGEHAAAEEAKVEKEADALLTPQQAQEAGARGKQRGDSTITDLTTAAQVRDYLNLDGTPTRQEVEQAIERKSNTLSIMRKNADENLEQAKASKDPNHFERSYETQWEVYSENAELQAQRARLIDLVMADAHTATVTPEATAVVVKPMTREDALSTLRLKDRRMGDRSILSKPEIEDAYNKELAKARELAGERKISKEVLRQTEDEYERARKVLLDEVDGRIADHKQQVEKQVAVVRDVLGAKFADDPNVKQKDQLVIEDGFAKVATRVAEQIVKRGETFNPANREHADRLKDSMMEEINSNPRFKEALADPDVAKALQQASVDPGGSTATRSVAREARSSYSRQKMYDDVDANLKKFGIGVGVGLAVVVVLSAIVYELIQHNVIPV